MTLLQHLKALHTQTGGVRRDRCTVQQQALPMHLDRPNRIGAEEQWIFNQDNWSGLIQCWMIRKQLMRVDQRDLHSSGFTGETTGAPSKRGGISTIHGT